MAEFIPFPPAGPANALARNGTHGVRLDVRNGGGPARSLRFDQESILVGTVAGCDVRLPGGELPPLVCLLYRRDAALILRKLAPAQLLLLNGTPSSDTTIKSGDMLTLGQASLQFHIDESSRLPAFKTAHDPEEHARLLTEGIRKLKEAQKQFEEDRRDWEQDAERQAEALALRSRQLLDGEKGLAAARNDFESECKSTREAEAAQRTADLAALDEQRRLIVEWQRDSERETSEREARFAAEIERLATERQVLETGQAQHREDLARLERLHATMQVRQQESETQAELLATQTNQLHTASLELQAHRQSLDAAAVNLREAETSLATRKEAFEAEQRQFHARVETLESQQGALVALRTRTERFHAELRQREQLLTERRLRQTRAEEELRVISQQLHDQRVNLQRDRDEWHGQRQELEQHCAHLEATRSRIKEMQATFDQQGATMADERAAIEAQRSQIAEQLEAVRLRADRLRRVRSKLIAQRQSLRGQANEMLETEEARATFQEQLRRRADIIAESERRLATTEQQQHASLQRLTKQQQDWETERQRLADEMAQLRLSLAQREATVAEREKDVQTHAAELQTALQSLQADRATLDQERGQMESRERQAAELLDRTQRANAGIQTQLPDLTKQVLLALERLGKAREQLREHLAEVHHYAQQSQAESEAAQRELAAHAERLRQQQHTLTRGQDEHRHSVSSFRQYLSEWQGQIAELKRSLVQGESVLERREAQLSEQARHIEVSSQQLTERAELLEDQERAIVEQREELNRHLSDMQQWYRRKLRELAERNLLEPIDETQSDDGPSILPLHREVSGVDNDLAERLLALELIEYTTLTQILDIARMQRVSLRSALLESGCLTSFQMERIEAGNLQDLVVGPLRLVDCLRRKAMETIYRVFDPRRGQEGLLRVLSAAASADQRAEFLERFIRVGTLRHANVAGTWEVLDAAGQPAVLQEWLVGLPSTEWGPVAATPAVWVRLLSQAVAGLAAAQNAGIEHGHLHANRIVLTEPGEVKICGLGEPLWLHEEQAATTIGDLEALSEIAADWLSHSGRKAFASAHREAIKPVLQRLLSDEPNIRYPSAAALIDHLHDVAVLLADDGGAWSKLLNFVHERLRPETPLRKTA